MISNYKTISCDALILGGGGAGCRAAIEVAKRGADVILVSKEIRGKAHTCMAEGGMNVANPRYNPKNNPDILFKDTVSGGEYIGNQKMIRIFSNEIPERIYDLERFGMMFDRDENGKMIQRFSGHQTNPHNVIVGDYFGRELMAALLDQMRRYKVRLHDETFVTNIMVQKNAVCGAAAIDIKTGEFLVFRAKAVMLATGGGGRIYKITSNAASNTGDGYAMAFNLGLPLIDMEMVQFHPTGMVLPESCRGALVSESVRGEGGILRNKNGERFMTRYNPKTMELSGRDEVARSIYAEVQEGRGTPNGGVYLDVTHLPAAQIEAGIPKMLEQFLRVGVDIRKEPMEIHPTAHHIMGGIKIDECGRTKINGLFAAGEVAGGVHGANRLGGNSVSDTQVFGKRTGESMYNFCAENDFVAFSDKNVDEEYGRVFGFLKRERGKTPDLLERELRELMWDNVGIVREESKLLEAKKRLAKLKKDVARVACLTKKPYCNMEWITALELVNMVQTAEIITEAALARKESRGAHFRKDYPKQDNKNWLVNVVVQKEGDTTKTTASPVELIELRPDSA